MQAWLSTNVTDLTAAVLDDDMPEMVLTELLSHTPSKAVRSVADQSFVPQLLGQWSNGEPYSEMMRSVSARTDLLTMSP